MQLSIDSCSGPFGPQSFFPPTYKIVLVGNLGVGKTTLLWRYIHKEFRSSKVTVIDVERKRTTIQNREVELEFWDTAGQERFRTISPSYYLGAHAIIVIYDMTDRESFVEVKQYWLKEIFGLFGEDADHRMPIMLVGTKADEVNASYDDEQTFVKKRDVMELKREYDRMLGPYECSARTGENVEKAFSKIAEDLVLRDTVGMLQYNKDLDSPSSCKIC